MKRRVSSIAVAAVWTLLASASHASEDSPRSSEDAKVQLLPVPSGISEQEVRAGGRGVQIRLAGIAVHDFDSNRPRIADDRCGPIVIFVDSRGVPISPAAPSPGVTTAHDLVFTFDSPGDPWSDAELTLLQTYVGDFYPALKQIYGDPATSDTIDVVHDPSSGYAGRLAGNVIILQSLRDDILCHEMVHAFHGPLALRTSLFEEGMTRGAEIEVFDQLPQYVHPWDDAHSFPDDVFYEANNTAGIAGALLPPMNLLGYQLAGYAIGKCALERSTFFRDFNDTLYAVAQGHPYVVWDDAEIRSLMAAVLPNVEGLAWTDWVMKQHILTYTLSRGDHLYQEIGDWQFKGGRRTFPIWFYEIGRDIAPVTNTPIHWEITDWEGGLLARGTSVTGGDGAVFIDPPIPPGYLGMVRSVARAQGAFGAVADTVYRNFGGDDSGVFGVALEADIDSVSITNVDDPATFLDLPLVRGAFVAPSLGPVRGRFEARFHRRDGTTGTRRFNKDASSYLVLLGTADGTPGGVDPLAAGHGVLVEQNRPNPFNPFTTISYHVERESRVALRIFNAEGRWVRTLLDEDQTPGAHEITWDGALEGGGAAPSGVYFYRVDALGKSVTKKMVVMR